MRLVRVRERVCVRVCVMTCVHLSNTIMLPPTLVTLT